MIVSDTLFDSRGGFSGYAVKLSDEDTADFEVRWDVAMATNLAYYMGCTLAPPGECI